jgi:hypothetical protein
MARGAAAEAAALPHAPDRSEAFLALASQAEGARRDFYRLLALRENALLDPALLEEMAQSFSGAEKRFLLNRARVQRRQPVEPGEERRPTPPAPEIGPALKSMDRDAARNTIEMARSAGSFKEVERVAWSWWEQAADQRGAALFLHEIGLADKALAAARKLRSPDDQAALAVIYAAKYPEIKTWETLCRSRASRVREAAADAAVALAHTSQSHTFLGALGALLDDSEESVRLSAFLAFRAILPDAESAGYDHRKPEKEAIARLLGLATNKAAAAGGDR